MELAVTLNLHFVDLDQEIEKAEKQTIRSIFSEKGEAHFRQLEFTHLRRVLSELDAFVMATGGGTPCFFDNMDFMNTQGTTLFINTPISTIKQRLQQDSVRPLMQTTTLEDLFAEREQWYVQAHHTIATVEEANQVLGLK